MPMTTRLDDLLRREAHKKLQNDWEEATKNTKIKYLPLVERKVNLRVQHKYVPFFTVWVELCEPQYRHRWMMVNMNETENTFEGFDFDKNIPCPITRAQAELHPQLKQMRKGKPGEDYNLIHRASREGKRGNDDRSEESKNLSSKEKLSRREKAQSKPTPGSPVLEGGRGRGSPNK